MDLKKITLKVAKFKIVNRAVLASSFYFLINFLTRISRFFSSTVSR